MSQENAHRSNPDLQIYKKQSSMIRGIETWFDLDPQTVVSVWLSTWTGREIIRINDQIIVSKRVIKLTSRHPFTYNGKDYAIVIKFELLGEFRIELWQGAQLIDFDVVANGRVLSRGQGVQKAGTKNIIVGLLMGGLLGILGMLFGYWVGGGFGG